MGRRAAQEVFKGFEQGRVSEVETWADKFDTLRSNIAGLTGEMNNAELKLREAMHLHESEVDKQESEDGDKLLVYKYGDYKVVVKRGREKVNVKIGEKSSDVATDEPDLGDDPGEDGE